MTCLTWLMVGLQVEKTMFFQSRVSSGAEREHFIQIKYMRASILYPKFIFLGKNIEKKIRKIPSKWIFKQGSGPKPYFRTLNLEKSERSSYSDLDFDFSRPHSCKNRNFPRVFEFFFRSFFRPYSQSLYKTHTGDPPVSSFPIGL